MMMHRVYVTVASEVPRKNKKYVEEQLQAGKDVILEIEIQGALKIREQFPDALLLFIAPPNAEELKNRLVNRGTETLEVIEKRLARAAEEVQGIENYDYLVVNDILDECVEMVHNTIQCEHFRMSRKMEEAQELKKQISAFAKGE
jgi:guanylate kinase